MPTESFQTARILLILLRALKDPSSYGRPERGHSMAAEIDIKAKALSNARDRILELQKQMTDRVLQMAAEVENLMAVVPEKEARSFLKVRCNLPAVELSTYIGFAKTLKGSEDVLRTGRVSFPVLKSLVSADDDTREEVLARIELGAQIDTKDVATIKRRLAHAKLSTADITLAHDRKVFAAAVRKQAKASVESFRTQMASFVDDLRGYVGNGMTMSDAARRGLRQEADRLLQQFEFLFGSEHPAQSVARNIAPDRMIGVAHKVLGDFASGRSLDFNSSHIAALQSLTGRRRVQFSVSPRQGQATIAGLSHPRVVELCAGAGGLALGLEKAGFHHVALIEQNRHAAATMRLNRPEWPVVEEDVRKVDFTAYRKDFVDLVAGGLPCTPFSSVGKGKGKQDENDLMMEGVRAVRELSPKAFLFENVDGLLHAKHADYIADLLGKFSRLGYVTEIHRINARDYGIAQNRSRIMIVGLRKDLAGSFRMPPRFPEMATNMGDVLADLMGANGWTGADAWVRSMQERPFTERGRLVQQGFLSDTIRAYQGSAQELEGKRAGRNGVSYAPPAKAAPTNEEARREGFVPGLTNRMRARLQDFGDDWEFSGGLQAVATQIGNAVPVGVARAMGLAMHSALKGVGWNWDAMFSKQARTIVVPPALSDSYELGQGRKTGKYKADNVHPA